MRNNTNMAPFYSQGILAKYSQKESYIIIFRLALFSIEFEAPKEILEGLANQDQW